MSAQTSTSHNRHPPQYNPIDNSPTETLAVNGLSSSRQLYLNAEVPPVLPANPPPRLASSSNRRSTLVAQNAKITSVGRPLPTLPDSAMSDVPPNLPSAPPPSLHRSHGSGSHNRVSVPALSFSIAQPTALAPAPLSPSADIPAPPVPTIPPPPLPLAHRLISQTRRQTYQVPNATNVGDNFHVNREEVVTPSPPLSLFPPRVLADSIAADSVAPQNQTQMPHSASFPHRSQSTSSVISPLILSEQPGALSLVNPLQPTVVSFLPQHSTPSNVPIAMPPNISVAPISARSTPQSQRSDESEVPCLPPPPQVPPRPSLERQRVRQSTSSLSPQTAQLVLPVSPAAPVTAPLSLPTANGALTLNTIVAPPSPASKSTAATASASTTSFSSNDAFERRSNREAAVSAVATREVQMRPRNSNTIGQMPVRRLTMFLLSTCCGPRVE